jgi:hypothetical protein
VAPPGRTVVDDLRAYAASLAALENQLYHVAEADARADAVVRARSAILQDTALWSPPPALDVDLAGFLADDRTSSSFQTPITGDTPARPRGPRARRDAAAVAPRHSTVDVDDVLDAFLADDDTPTPSLSPLEQRRTLIAMGTHAVTSTVTSTTPTALRRAALALMLILLGTGVAVAVASALR